MRSVFFIFEKQNEEAVIDFLDEYCDQSFYVNQDKQWNVLKDGDGLFYIYQISPDELFAKMEDKTYFNKLDTMEKPLSVWQADISGRHNGRPEIKDLFIALLSKIHGYAVDDYTDYFWSLAEIKADEKIMNHPFFDYTGWYQSKKEGSPMKHYRITVLRGDGIGPEIVAEALKVLDKAAALHGFQVQATDALMGGCAIDATGVPLPEATIDACLSADAVLLGAVGGAKWDTLPGHLRPEAGLLGIRAAMGLFANLRPAKIYAPLKAACPLKEEVVGDGLDLLVVRELTGGIYFGARGRDKEDGVESAFDTERYNTIEITRIARVAFEAARGRTKHLTSIDKANVLESSRLWRETVTAVAKDYPDVALSHMYVDNAAMQLVRNPRQFDVLLASNIFGDILSDEASQVAGSIGMLASASLGEGTRGLYEPIHGSAPDIAGQGVANPLATILSAAMLLRYSLREDAAADAIEEAVARVLDNGLRTADIYTDGTTRVGTVAMGDAVCAALG